MKTIYSTNHTDPLPSHGMVFPQRIASFDSHAEAQRSVDYLADHDFLIKECQIVGTDLRRVEQVVGRATAARAAGTGAVGGLWIGLFVGLALSLFAAVPGWSVVVAGSVVIGGAFGVILGLVAFVATRTRSLHFATTVHTEAGRYDLLVEHRYAEWARTILVALPGGLGSGIPPSSQHAS